MTEQPTEIVFFPSSRKRRIAAFLIDHFVLTALMVAVVFFALGPEFMDEFNLDKMRTIMMMVMLPGFVLYFSKDSFKGRSLGKWIMGIMVRDENNKNEIPSYGRLVLRNIFIIIWPVEFIVLATSHPKKRIGDKVAHTLVLKNPNKPSKLPRIGALIGIGAIFFIFVIFTTGSALKHSAAYKIAVTEIEKNEQIVTETGGITGYGMMPKGNIRIVNGHGQAQLEIKVLGNTKDVTVHASLEKEQNGEWKLIELQ